MPESVPPPAQDDHWDATIAETSPPVGGWDRDALVIEAMSVLGLSHGDAEAVLDEHTPGQLRTLLDRHLTRSHD